MLKFAGQDSRCVSEVDTSQSAMKKGFLLQSGKENAETADTGTAPMDIDPPFKTWGKQARFVFVEDRDGHVHWGQPHEKQCGQVRAQDLAECLIQSYRNPNAGTPERLALGLPHRIGNRAAIAAGLLS